MNWVPHNDFGFRAAKWVLLAVTILFGLTLCTGFVKFFSSRAARKRDASRSENDYWRIHGGD